MSDEQAPAAEAEDKPTTDAEAPVEDKAPETEESFDYEKAYNELRPAYTQTTQREAQHRTIVEAAQNPNHPNHAEAVEYLGWQTEGDEEDTEWDDDDPTEALRGEISEIRSLIQERDQQAELKRLEDAEETWLADQIQSLQGKKGIEFDDNELRLLVSVATGSRKDDGQPDIEGAYKTLTGAWDSRQKAYLNSKRAPQAPAGASASTDIDLDDDEQRREHMLRMYNDVAA